LQNSVAIFIKQSKDPKIYELDIAISCIFNQCAELSYCEAIGKIEEVKESLEQKSTQHSFILIYYHLSAGLDVINLHITNVASHPHFKSLQLLFLIHFEFLMDMILLFLDWLLITNDFLR